MATKRVVAAFAVTTAEGEERVYRPGDLVDDSDDKIYTKARAQFFEDVDVAVQRGRTIGKVQVESATAAPGELRNVSAPKKTAAKKTAEKTADEKK
jgi:hypothetical protein